MISSFGGNVVLGVLAVLASGHIIYDAPLCRWFLSGKHTGYVLYFRIITDDGSAIDIKTDYSKVFGPSEIKNNYMLIQADKIVTMQPFDIEIFEQFSSAPK